MPSNNTYKPDLSQYTTVSSLNAYINEKKADYKSAKDKGKSTTKIQQDLQAARAKKTKIKEKNAEKKAKQLNKTANSSKMLFGSKKELDENDIDPDTGINSSNSFLYDNAMVSNNTMERIGGMMTSSLTGIEGMPYQFSSIVDRRLPGYDPIKNDGIGRKFGEKIVSRFPLLFITPCTVDFMKGFSDEDKSTVTQALLAGGDIGGDIRELLAGHGRYYSANFAYVEYYQYLNCMLNALAIYLGLGDVKVKINGKNQPLGKARWNNEMPDEFKTFFSSQENLIFYVDGFSSVSQSFSNDTSDSSLASTINGFAEQVNEIKFLFGAGDGVASEVYGMAGEVTTSITAGLSATLGKLGGGIVESLANNGVNTILNGGKIIFPEIWSNSSTDDGSASFDFKFRSPDNDTLSIYLNVLKPYCKLLCLVMAHQSKKEKGAWDKVDENSYTAPFIVKSALKGKFSVDTGIISSMSVTKGAECQWNDDGLPTQIDVSIDIKNLYKNLSISTYDQPSWSIVSNTAYMDFIANMAGMNILQQDMFRKQQYFIYLTTNKIAQFLPNRFSNASQAISKLMGRLYDLTS